MLGPPRRIAIVAIVAFFLIASLWLNLDRLEKTSLGAKIGDKINPFHGATTRRPAVVQQFFQQVFSVEKPAPYPFPAIKYTCENTKWNPELKDVYLQCGHMFAGMTSIISQVKVCMKMAMDTGVGIILPSMPLRDSTDLKEFNFLNGDAYMTYDKWFDVEHLIEGMGRACPQIKILHPDQLGPDKINVRHEWDMDVAKAPGYRQFNSHFWAGRPFKQFFDEEYAKLVAVAPKDEGAGITSIKIASLFLIFRITDDPTGRDLRLWNDFSLLIRFLEPPRKIANQLLSHITRPFYGVHFRVENDTIWSSLENQLKLDLDALDQAWEQFNTDVVSSQPPQKPLVYLACGDETQMAKFIEAGSKRGWDVTHKWALARSHSDESTLQMIDALAFDFQGAVDMGVMIQSSFFLGISGSAFSSSVANARDVTGRYRGSSFTSFDDDGARSHLFNDGDAKFLCLLLIKE